MKKLIIYIIFLSIFSYISFAIDINISINNTEPLQNDYVNLSANVSNIIPLFHANFTINLTSGIYQQNYTLSYCGGFLGCYIAKTPLSCKQIECVWYNVTTAKLSNYTQITDPVGNVLNYTVFVMDYYGVYYQNSTKFNVVTTTTTTTTTTSTTTTIAASQPIRTITHLTITSNNRWIRMSNNVRISIK